jgi:hypothetical protein
MAITRKQLVVVLLLTAFVYVASVFASFVVGVAIGNRQAYNNRYLEEAAVLMQVISEDKDFIDVELFESSEGLACLRGRVSSREVHDRLESKVRGLFGERSPRYRTRAVDIRKSTDGEG